jgi:hypothetical protein
VSIGKSGVTQVARGLTAEAERSRYVQEEGSIFFFQDVPARNLVRNRDCTYRGADKSLARPTSRCILFDG